MSHVMNSNDISAASAGSNPPHPFIFWILKYLLHWVQLFPYFHIIKCFTGEGPYYIMEEESHRKAYQ